MFDTNSPEINLVEQKKKFLNFNLPNISAVLGPFPLHRGKKTSFLMPQGRWNNFLERKKYYHSICSNYNHDTIGCNHLVHNPLYNTCSTPLCMIKTFR